MTTPITAIGPGGAQPLRTPLIRAHLIRDDAEALAAAAALAAGFAPGAALRDRERRLPLAQLRQIRQSGLWGITVPREYGGAGVSYATLARVIEAHDILRIKGPVAVRGRPARLMVQAVGPRIEHYFDRPWGGDARRSQLVVIGQTGLDEAAIRAVLAPAFAEPVAA